MPGGDGVRKARRKQPGGASGGPRPTNGQDGLEDGGSPGGRGEEMPEQFVGSLSNLDVNFDPMSAPPPAFAGVCVVHRFPEYVLIDFGSIDPLRVEPTGPGAGRAMLQHVGRLCLPVSVAKRLVGDLSRSLGE